MIDGIMCVVCFMIGFALAFSMSTHYNNKIYELMRMMNAKPRRRKEHSEADDEFEVKDEE